MSASQGAAPSTPWGEGVLDRMAAGEAAEAALSALVEPDTGRAWRQLSCLDTEGRTAAHSGEENGAFRGHLCQPDAVAAGNILASPDTLEVLVGTWRDTPGPMSARLLAALNATQAAGGDRRGLQSAALLVLDPERPPLTLRVDLADEPLTALAELHERATTGPYAEWTRAVPTPADPMRADGAIIRAGAGSEPQK